MKPEIEGVEHFVIVVEMVENFLRFADRTADDRYPENKTMRNTYHKGWVDCMYHVLAALERESE